MYELHVYRKIAIYGRFSLYKSVANTVHVFALDPTRVLHIYYKEVEVFLYYIELFLLLLLDHSSCVLLYFSFR